MDRLTAKHSNSRRTKQGPPTAPLAEVGLTGLRYWSGRLDEEFLTELKWDQARKIYREMGDNDATIGALFNVITLEIRSVPWRVEKASDTEDNERADLIDSCRDDMSHSWTDLLSEITRGTLQYGWQWHELVYKRRLVGKSAYNDGQIGWKKIPVRAQDTLFLWDFDLEGGTQAMIQVAPPDWTQRRLPIEKALLFRTESIKNSPEGRSILRNAYRPWYYKKRIENIEGVGVERDLAGFPLMRVPARILSATASADEKAVRDYCEKLITGIKRDEQEGALIPSETDERGNKLYDLVLLSSAGERQFNTTEIINRYDLRILQLMLADFIQLGHEKVGSFALSSNKTNLFAVAIGVFLDQIASVFNRYAIPRLLELNGLDLEDPPQLMHGDIESRDLLELGDYLTKLSGAGMPLFPNPKLEAALLEAADLPVPTPEEAGARDAMNALEREAMLQQQQDQGGGAANAVPNAVATMGGAAVVSPPSEEKAARAFAAVDRRLADLAGALKTWTT